MYLYDDMDSSTIYTIIITLITVLTSGAAIRFYENRIVEKTKRSDFIKDDCKERIIKMELLLERSSDEKEEMRSEILRLTAMVAELKVRVEFLEKENRELRSDG